MNSIAFNNFEHVEHTPLRVYNRAVFASNLLEDYGEEVTKNYFSQFTNNERISIALMIKQIKDLGVEATKKLVTRDLITVYDPEDDLDDE